MQKYVLIAKNKSEKHPKEFILMYKNKYIMRHDEEFFFHDLNDMKMLAKTNPLRATQRHPKRNGRRIEAFIMVFPSAADAKKMLLQILEWARYCDYWKNFLATHYVRVANANSENFSYVIPDAIKGIDRRRKYTNCTSSDSKNIYIYEETIELGGYFTEEFYSKLNEKVAKRWDSIKKKTQKSIKNAGLNFEDIAFIPERTDYKYCCKFNYTLFCSMYKKGGTQFLVKNEK